MKGEKEMAEISLLSLLEKEDMDVRNYNRACEEVRYWDNEKEKAEYFRKEHNFNSDAGLDLQALYLRNSLKAMEIAFDMKALLIETRMEIKEYFRVRLGIE